MEKEIWKAVIGHEGLYEVSNMGKVRNTVSGKNLKESHHKRDPYGAYNLFIDGKREKIRSHILVAKAFLGYVPNKGVTVCDHINEDKKDNRLVNLQIITCGENSRKAYDNKKTLGVSLHKPNGKWKVTLPLGYEKRHGGYFFTKEEASNAYNKLTRHIIK